MPWDHIMYTGLILGLRPANERRRYKVTLSLMGWAQTKNQPCVHTVATSQPNLHSISLTYWYITEQVETSVSTSQTHLFCIKSINSLRPDDQGLGQLQFFNSNSNSHIFRFCNSNSRVYNSNSRTFNSNSNYTNPGYGLSLVDTLWNAGSYRQPLKQEGNPMT